MGRRGVGVEEDARWVFNRLAAAYRYRPGYPEALVERLAELAGEGERRVVDLGAGTGHLALPLARRRLRVSAVEPARAMLAELRRQADAEALPIEGVHASAERTGLQGGGFSLVLLADAVHWVDPELAGQEAARLLSPSGTCAVVEVELGRTPFLDALKELIERANPKARHPPRASVTAQLLALARPGARPHVERFTHELVLDEVALEGTLRSLSFVGPALGPEALEALLGSARELARLHGAAWRRELTLTWAGGRSGRRVGS